MSQSPVSESSGVRAVQYAILVIFSAYALGVVVWVAHLLRVAIQWRDSFSASVGISLVAIPVFLLILGLVQYLFWGLRRHRRDAGPTGRHPAEPSPGRSTALSVLIPLILALAGESGAAQAQEDLPDNPVKGWSLFVEKQCVLCHSVRGAGGGSRGPDLGLVGLSRSRLDLAGEFWNYGPHMSAAMQRVGIPYPTINPEEMKALLPFIYLLGYFDPPPDIERGQQVYNRAVCARCHGKRGEGGGAAPSLSSVSSGASAIELATAIWNHGPNMANETARLGIPYPRFAGRDLLDLVGYLRDVALPSDAPLRLQPVGSPRHGMQLLEKKGCLSCHKLSGRGGSAGPDLSAAEDLVRSQTLLVTAMWNHGPRMWAGMRASGKSVPRLTEQEMVDLVSALFFMRYKDRNRDVGAGERAFVSKGCVACHSSPKEGASAAQYPLRPEMLESDEAVASAIWNHLPKMYLKMEEMGRPWPSFAQGELANLVAYLRSKRER